MTKLLGKRLKTYELTDRNSQVEATLALRQAQHGFVVIFAHGSSDYLRGGEYRCRITEEHVETEKFLTRTNLDVLNGKVVFCMSCDSNGLAQACLDAGALAFVGFDEIPFRRFDAAGEEIKSGPLTDHCQKLIATSVQAAIDRFLTGHATLDESIDFLRLWVAQNAITYVRRMERGCVKERKEVAALFLKLKTGVKYHGALGIRFLNNG